MAQQRSGRYGYLVFHVRMLMEGCITAAHPGGEVREVRAGNRRGFICRARCRGTTGEAGKGKPCSSLAII